MTYTTEVLYTVSRTDVDGPGSFASNGAPPPPAKSGTCEAQASQPPTPPVPADGVPLIDRVSRTLRVLREAEWRCLHERGGLIELKFNRRQKLVSVRLCNGVALAHINAALRIGMRDRLPIAEDSRTVEIEPGLKTTFRFVRTAAWSPPGHGRR